MHTRTTVTHCARSARRAIILVGLVAVAAPLAAGCSSKPSTQRVKGTLTLNVERQDVEIGDGGACLPQGGYSDIYAGAGVTVTDAKGTVIGTGQLGSGTTSTKPDTEAASSDPVNCTFPFTVKDVPTGSKFYGVEVSHRGVIQFTSAQVSAGKVGMSLGDN